MGAMVPYFEGRVGPGWDQLGKRTSDVDYAKLLRKLKKRPLDYFRMFYADTALFGAWEATKCGLRFFGPQRVLFASDAPFDPEALPAEFVESGSARIRIVRGLPQWSEVDRLLVLSPLEPRLGFSSHSARSCSETFGHSGNRPFCRCSRCAADSLIAAAKWPSGATRSFTHGWWSTASMWGSTPARSSAM